VPVPRRCAPAYQKEENRVLRELLGDKRPLFTDAQRRRLAIKAKALSHATLRELGSLVTPDTLVQEVRGCEVRQLYHAACRPTAQAAARPRLSHPPRERKPRVGIHQDPRCDAAPRP
jgi:hypothetical protein